MADAYPIKGSAYVEHDSRLFHIIMYFFVRLFFCKSYFFACKYKDCARPLRRISQGKEWQGKLKFGLLARREDNNDIMQE